MPTYYIDPAGDDGTGDGSSGNPWLTIAHAHTTASGGDTIIVNDGTYTWLDQTFAKALTIQGESTPTYDANTLTWSGAIFDGAGAELVWNSVGLAITLNDLIFTDATRVGGVGNQGFFHSGNWTLTRCVIYSIMTDNASSSFVSFFSWSSIFIRAS